MKIGIEAIGIAVPHRFISAKDLAELRHIAIDKVAKLGCVNIAITLSDHEVVDLAVKAAKRALSRFHGQVSEIGLIAVGTESALDETRPLSAWIAEDLQIHGSVRSYEVKHACYGGTLALLQAAEWIRSSPMSRRVALVISTDICLYEPGSLAELTQGAGSIAMIVSQDPKIASINPISYPYSLPCFDFFRPSGQKFPTVHPVESVKAYARALNACLSDMFARNSHLSMRSFYAVCFHVPFPAMVRHAFEEVAAKFGINDLDGYWQNKIAPFMRWNVEIGNSYTASVWISVAQTLASAKEGDLIACFSYGSGCGAELLILTKSHATCGIEMEMQQDISSRVQITKQGYLACRA